MSTKTEANSAHPLVGFFGCLRLRCDPRLSFSLSVKARLDALNIILTTSYLNGVTACVVGGNAIQDFGHDLLLTAEEREGWEVAHD